MAEGCCTGEPFRGDPNGLHTFDCPVYQANCERLESLEDQRTRALVDTQPEEGAPPK